jgi:acetolactate synthase regulatory subunit
MSNPTAAGRARPVACFSVSASAEPGVMPRVLEVFAKRGLVPAQWHSSVCAGARLEIDVQVIGLEAAPAARLAGVLRQLVCVDTVLTAERPCAEGA